MLLVGKVPLMKDVLEEHGLENILRVRLILQMYRAEPLDGIPIPGNGSGRLLLAAHLKPSSHRQLLQPWPPP